MESWDYKLFSPRTRDGDVSPMIAVTS